MTAFLKLLDLRDYLIAGLLLLAGLLFANGQGHRAEAVEAKQALLTLQAAYSAAEAEAKGLALAAQENSATARAAASVSRRRADTQSKEQLHEQIQAAPDWSAAPVPNGLRNALKAARDRAAGKAPGDSPG